MQGMDMAETELTRLEAGRSMSLEGPGSDDQKIMRFPVGGFLAWANEAGMLDHAATRTERITLGKCSSSMLSVSWTGTPCGSEMEKHGLPV